MDLINNDVQSVSCPSRRVSEHASLSPTSTEVKTEHRRCIYSSFNGYQTQICCVTHAY